MTDIHDWCVKMTLYLTKKDLDIAPAPLKTDLAVLKWGTGLVIAGVAAQLFKAFPVINGKFATKAGATRPQPTRRSPPTRCAPTADPAA